MMRILLTGGAGFIGSHIAEGYLKEGHQVAVVDNLSTGKRENIPKGVFFYHTDIRNAEEIEHIFSEFRPEVVNHHAAQASVPHSSKDPIYDASVNLIGSLNLIIASVQSGVRRFIYASTGGAVYGNPRYLPVDEEHPLVPTSPYGISKMVVEHYLRFYGKEKGLSWVALRYGNVYGPRQDPDGHAGVVAIFAGKMMRGEKPIIYGDGSSERDYVFVSDVVAANILALKYGTGPINIATGCGTSVSQIYETLSNLLDWNDGYEQRPSRPGEVQRVFLSIERAKKDIKWQPKVGLMEGVRITLEWIRRFLKITS